tara:strand:+ start:419 stop:742 length:324 start_codon:yes stop_codon:yes gene_type:complete
LLYKRFNKIYQSVYITKKNIYTIIYEDLFSNNYAEFKKILNNIGFQYDDSIFDNNKCSNVHVTNTKLVDEPPPNNQHVSHRTWQINQSFIFHNDMSKIDLNEDQINE